MRLEKSRLTRLRLYALKDLEKIRLAKEEIAKSSNLLIKAIGETHKTALKKLNNFEKTLSEILHREVFFELNIEALESNETVVSTFKFDEIKNQIENVKIQITCKEREEEKKRKEEEEQERIKRIEVKSNA